MAEPVILLDDGGLGFVVERLWAYLCIHEDGDEAIVGASIGGWMMPLIAADKARLDALRPYAEHAARSSSKPIKLVRFDRRTDVEVIDG